LYLFVSANLYSYLILFIDYNQEMKNEGKRHRTLYKNNSGFSTKFKGRIFESSVVIN